MDSVWIINIILAFSLCICFASIVISQVLHIAFQRKLFDIPDERKIHQQMVPRLGGIIFKPVLFFSLILLVVINLSFGIEELPTAVRENAVPLAYLYCAVTMLHFVGIVDDLKGVDYHIKFLAQIICGTLFVGGKILITDFNGLFGIETLPTWIAIPFTIFIMVYVINAINLIDGIDGLASALCAIALVFYGEFFFLFHHYADTLLAFASVGVLIPFYYYNVFGKAEQNRKIFMGDTGTLTMGILICFLGIRLCQVKDTTPLSVPIDPILLAFSPLLIPCLDVIKVYLIRVIHGKNPFLPDKNHIHHKLMALGMTQRMAMIVLIMVSGLLISLNVALSIFVGTTVMLCIDLIVWIFMTLLIEHKLNAKENLQNK